MTAASPAPTCTDRALRLLHDDVRTGYACVATFSGPRGSAWVELLGPRGMRPSGEALVAPIPTLRLWVPGRADAPLAVAVADRDFDAGLDAIAEAARSHIDPQEETWLSAVLRVVRAAARGLRPRVPVVGGRLTEEGAPTLRAWASCLTLGDLEAAVLKAVA